MASELPEDLKPSNEESWSSGGTADILPRERALASFDVDKMSAALYGGADGVKRRRFILMPAASMVYPEKYEWTREEMMMHSIEDFIAIHKDFVEEGYRPERDEVGWMSEMATQTGPMMPHMGLFISTVMGQGSPQQVMAWLPRALNFQIIGCYSQTELSHGSNIRGLRTTATYDAETEEFVLSTPTLGSMKWWNSDIGCVATHAAVYAQLVIHGKEYGLHVFMVQVRDENHMPLPGVEVGDVGPKLGDQAIDTGYLRLKDVRVPREHLFAKRQHVEPDGTYVRHVKSKDPKAEQLAKRASYLTMMQARSGMASIAGGKLSIACTIAIRYSAVRHQGFSDAQEGQTFKAAENPVIDYQVQRYRLFKHLAIAYCMRASGNWMTSAISELSQAANATDDGDLDAKTQDLVNAMPEIHACSAGLKGYCCKIAFDSMEDLRKCCGGHGYLANSGIGLLAADFVWQVSAEGDWVVLLLQTGRYLMKARKDAMQGKPLVGLTACLEPLRRPDFVPASRRPREPSSVQAVMDPAYLLALFEFRTLATIVKVGDRLDACINKGLAFDKAWNQCAVSIKAAAEIHIQYFMLRNFLDVIRRETDENCVEVLQQLFCLFGLQNIVEGQGWAGILSADLVSLAESGIEQLLESIRPNAVALVDAFDIPDRVLNSTLGRKDGNVYEALYDAARNSSLNKKPVFEGYERVLRPHLDLDFLKLRGGVCDELNSKL
ncbi:A chain [Durusdinium trenchii]|uniref:Acyl-coenzyme A oxidase n=1 Tax=Durusdinium trenchii TaxID=1381693 RepID=A0ABP0SP87_9DINO